MILFVNLMDFESRPHSSAKYKYNGNNPYSSIYPYHQTPNPSPADRC